MDFSILSLIFALAVSYKLQVNAKSLDAIAVQSQSDDQEFVQEYASIKHALIYDLGYTKEFANMVEINLKRAIKEEKERQKQLGITPNRLRQGMQGTYRPPISAEYYEDEETTSGPTTPGPSAGDVVRGIAGILAGLGTLSPGNFWQSFVNFFPPGQREGAQAVVDASQGRRPAKWPTIPTTTTKLTTTTNSNELDSDETTKKVVSVVTSAPVVGATPAAGAAVVPAASASAPAVNGGAPSMQVVNSPAVTESALRVPTTKYALIRRRTGTTAKTPDDDDNAIALRGVDENASLSPLPEPETTQSVMNATLS